MMRLVYIKDYIYSFERIQFHIARRLLCFLFTNLLRCDINLCTKVSENHCFSDDYIINGGKMWTTNGAQADWMCVLANTSEGHPHKNKSLIIVPTKSEGFIVERKIDKLGMWSSDTVQSHFDNVRVPQKFRIGEEGFGFLYQMIQFQEERLFAAATCMYLFDICVSFCILHSMTIQVLATFNISYAKLNFLDCS